MVYIKVTWGWADAPLRQIMLVSCRRRWGLNAHIIILHGYKNDDELAREYVKRIKSRRYTPALFVYLGVGAGGKIALSLQNKSTVALT